MKNPMKKVLFLFSLFLFLSCDKLNPKSKFFGEWRIIKKEMQQQDGSWKNIMKECEKDDAEAYRNMGLWYYYPGENRCQPYEQIIQGSWNYEKSENRIVYTNSANVNISDAYVDLITKDSMTLTLHQGDTAKIKISYAKAK